MRAWLTYTLGSIAALLLAACAGGESAATSQNDGGIDASEGSSEAGTDAGCGPLVWDTPACASCTDQNCCSAEALCAAIPSCAPLNLCWNACGGDAGCTNACAQQSVDAISNYNAILNCQQNSCAAECATPK